MVTIETSSKWIAKLHHDYFKNQSEVLVITLPGFKYTQDSPIFHYLTTLFLELNVDLLCVKYGCQYSFETFVLLEEVATIEQEIMAVVNQLELAKYKKIIVIGKSLGTRFVPALEKHISEVNGKAELQLIYLTPTDMTLPQTLNQNMYFVMGSKDGLLSEEYRIRIQDSVSTCSIFEGANHSLEVGDVIGDIEMMRLLMDDIKNVVKQGNRT